MLHHCLWLSSVNAFQLSETVSIAVLRVPLFPLHSFFIFENYRVNKVLFLASHPTQQEMSKEGEGNFRVGAWSIVDGG